MQAITWMTTARLLAGMALAGQLLWAGEVVVKVTGISQDAGEIGCALFGDAKGFPMERANAKAVWQPANRAGVTCRFPGLTQGRYAVAVSHDVNGNRKTDTKLFGIPTEDWGYPTMCGHGCERRDLRKQCLRWTTARR